MKGTLKTESYGPLQVIYIGEDVKIQSRNGNIRWSERKEA